MRVLHWLFVGTTNQWVDWFLGVITIAALTTAVILLLAGPAKAGHDDTPYIYFDTGVACTTVEDIKEVIDMKLADGWFGLVQMRMMQGRCFGYFHDGAAVIFRAYFDKVVEQYIYEGDETKPVVIVQVHNQAGTVAYSWQRATITEFNRKLPEWTKPHAVGTQGV